MGAFLFLMGRPTIITEEITRKIEQYIRAGNFVEVAAAIAGISKDTFYAWLRRGARARATAERDGEEIPPEEIPFVAFSDAIERAEAVSESMDVACIGAAARRQWQAAAWRLERKHPGRWGRKEAFEVEKHDTMRIVVERTSDAPPRDED